MNGFDKKTWNTFVASQEVAPFLQSYEWGEFQQSLGRSVHAFGASGAHRLSAAGLMISHPLPGGQHYGYMPRAPLGDQTSIYEQVYEYAKLHGMMFVKHEPIASVLPENIQTWRMVKSHSLQPQDTLILNLQHDEVSLLKEMHTKTRYNIKVAQKNGVVVREISGNNAALEPFIWLLAETSVRNNFRTHESNYYEKLTSHFSGKDSNPHTPSIRTYLAEYGGRCIAGIMVMLFGDTATYLHGASSSRDREVMAPFLLQWHALREAKRNGYRHYDFWGIASTDDPRHPWAGITRFKKGFGGTVRHYHGAYDMVVRSVLYRGYRLARTLKGLL